jgi:glutamate synthase domain-containing protein 3
MSGGTAYVLDEDGTFVSEKRVNREMVDVDPFEDPEDIETVRELIEEHRALTGSAVAERVLDDWENMTGKFVKIMPVDYKRVLENMKREEREREIEMAQAAEALDPIAGEVSNG